MIFIFFIHISMYASWWGPWYNYISGPGGTVHQNWIDNEHVKFITAFHDPGEPWSCQDWGNIPDGGGPQIINDTFQEIVNLYKDTLTKELLAKHESHVCIIVSGTLSFLVKEIASLLGIKKYFGTEPEIIKGFFTGNPLGEPNFGREKVRKIKEWMISNQLDLDQQIYVYSDSIFDLPLLDLATIPTAISPDKKLRKVCSERSWKVIERNIL